MNIERNKFLTEKVLGECWHEWKPKKEPHHLQLCIHCRADKPFHENTDFSTWEGFGKLWEACQKKEWWKIFVWRSGVRGRNLYLNLNLIHPDRFADAVYEFLKGEEK